MNEPMEKSAKYLRVNEVAQMLQLSRAKVYQLMESGQLTYVQIGRCRRVPVAALDQLVQKSTIRAR